MKSFLNLIYFNFIYVVQDKCLEKKTPIYVTLLWQSSLNYTRLTLKVNLVQRTHRKVFTKNIQKNIRKKNFLQPS